jgi:hypothetical protein
MQVWFTTASLVSQTMSRSPAFQSPSVQSAGDRLIVCEPDWQFVFSCKAAQKAAAAAQHASPHTRVLQAAAPRHRSSRLASRPFSGGRANNCSLHQQKGGPQQQLPPPTVLFLLLHRHTPDLQCATATQRTSCAVYFRARCGVQQRPSAEGGVGGALTRRGGGTGV